MLVKEGGVQLLLTIVDTPGFGDAVDNSNWYVSSAMSTLSESGGHFVLVCRVSSLHLYPSLPRSWQPVIDHIDSKFEDYLNSESRVNRRQMPDSRVQCCLYFIAPSGHGWSGWERKWRYYISQPVEMSWKSHTGVTRQFLSGLVSLNLWIVAPNIFVISRQKKVMCVNVVVFVTYCKFLSK